MRENLINKWKGSITCAGDFLASAFSFICFYQHEELSRSECQAALTRTCDALLCVRNESRYLRFLHCRIHFI